jgi:hypothetical protein
MRWLRQCKRVLLTAVGIGIGFNGVVVAVAPGRIPATYGIAADGPDVAVLLRHRAVMLALIGSVLVVAAFRRELRCTAVSAAAVSMTAYALFALTAEVDDPQRRVAVADVVLLVMLAAAAAAPDRWELPRLPVRRS